MRDIKFRGYSIDDNAWHFGGYLKGSHGDHYIMVDSGSIVPAKEVRVDPVSVGQFTGLKDSKGVDIYEGDIVSYKVYEQFRESMYTDTSVVEYLEYGFSPFVKQCFVEDAFYNLEIEDVEVIGNKYTTPELLNQ